MNFQEMHANDQNQHTLWLNVEKGEITCEECKCTFDRKSGEKK